MSDVMTAVEAADAARPLPQWSAEYKLRHLLARPDLAKRVVAYLPPAIAAELADRLTETVAARLEREVRQIHEDLQQATSVTLARLAAEADRKRKELTDERFAKPSRLD